MSRLTDHRPSVDEFGTTERCIRSFVIKSIQLLVQGRSGNVFNSNCISDVGARNNMMLYLEDDPEIGATIKQTLETGFSVNPGDSFTLDILVNWPNDKKHLMVMEVWQFRIEPQTSDNPGSNATTLTDVRKSRFFEKLATLLKSLLVISRMLPAYQYSRNQTPQNYQMCYMIRRGPPDTNKLGCDYKQRSIGTLPTHNGALNVTVYYRTKMTFTSQAEVVVTSPVTAPYKYDRNELCFDEDHFAQNSCIRSQNSPQTFNDWEIGDRDNTDQLRNLNLNGKSKMTDISIESIKKSNVLLRQVKPAFSEQSLSEEDATEDKHSCENVSRNLPFHTLLSPANQDKSLPRKLSNHDMTVREIPPLREEDELEISRESQSRNKESKDAGVYAPGSAALKFAFNTDGNSAELSRLFAEMKEGVDLDLFHQPHRPSSAASGSDLSLSEDLERHEKTLKDFDDFICEFDNEALAYGGLVDEVM